MMRGILITTVGTEAPYRVLELELRIESINATIRSVRSVQRGVVVAVLRAPMAVRNQVDQAPQRNRAS